MRLYLAVAVLMLALVASTEAQDAIEDRFSKFGEQVTEFGRSIAEKAKDTFQSIGTSEFGQTTRNWFNEHFDKLKTKYQEITQQ